jgi:hypothetical protein
MTGSDQNKGLRDSFLLSLILHVLIALVLGAVLLEQPREKAMESVAVDMVQVTRRAIPPRRMELRESFPDFREPTAKKTAKAQVKPRDFNPADSDFAMQSRSSGTRTAFPELATNADRLKSRFDTPLPRPTGATIMKPGTGTREGPVGGRSGAGSVGLPGEAGIFETALYWVARNIVNKNKTGKEDIVFLIDASGSMEENIAGVARYIIRMIDVFRESDLDYTMGVIEFNRVLKNNKIRVYEQTRDANQVRRILRDIQCDGDERTLDAMEVGLTQVKFRDPVDRTFVLVTDEAFTPRTLTRRTREGVALQEMLQEDFREIVEMCKSDNVKVNVLGIEDEMHKSLSKETGGLWFQIPQQEGLP